LEGETDVKYVIVITIIIITITITDTAAVNGSDPDQNL
jgi:hypothetical protein